MQTFDQALVELIKEDRVSYEEALKVASRPQDFRLMVQALGLSNIRQRGPHLATPARARG
jgi:twitching motility protein PilT